MGQIQVIFQMVRKCQNFPLSCLSFVSLQMKFTPALSREFRPYKPDPAPLLHICSTWGLPPNEVMMIGDSLKDDVSIISYHFFEIKPAKDGW